MTGAIIGSAVVGAATSYSSGKSASKAAKLQADASNKATEASLKASEEQLAFQKQQYADWEDIFGPIQDNLSSYYQTLSPDTYTSLGLQNLQKSYQTSRDSLDRSLAQRGLSNSGAAVQGLTDLSTQRMLGEANIRQSAPQAVESQKQNFLSIGLGLQPGLQSGIANAYGNIANTNMNAATNALNMQGKYSSQAASAYSGVGKSLGAGFNAYNTYNALNGPSGYGGSSLISPTPYTTDPYSASTLDALPINF